MYTRSDPKILENISSKCDGRTSRDIYKEMVLNDSIECPRDFKQVRNMKYNRKKEKNSKYGNKNNASH